MKSFLILLLLHPILAAPQALPEETYRAIVTAQDLRDAEALVPFLKDNDSQVRARAAIACGSVQDTLHIPHLLPLLADRNHHVRIAAAFALGQYHPVVDTLQREAVSRALTKRLGLEPNRAVLLRVLEALGKVGNEASLSVVVAAGETAPSPLIKGEAALAVGRYAYRGIRSKSATAFAAKCLALRADSETWKAAYALMRIADANLLAPYEEEIVRSSSHRSADVRMFIATTLGEFGSSRKAFNALLSFARAEKDWRVKVNTLRALAHVDTAFYPRMMSVLLHAAADSNEHVALSALTTIGALRLRGSSFAAECCTVLVRFLRSGHHSQQRKQAAAVSLARILGEEAYPLLLEHWRAGNLTNENLAAALAHVPTREAAGQLLQLYPEEEIPGKVRVIESLLSIARAVPERAEVVQLVRPLLAEAIQSNDIALLSTAATALADSTFADDETPVFLLNALRRLKPPDDTEAMITLMQLLADLNAQNAIAPLESYLLDADAAVARAAGSALHRLTGKAYSVITPGKRQPAYRNFDWTLLASLRRNPYVRVQTTKGEFTIVLLPENAPLTCVNFAMLIEKKFFDGLTFHRVVPNFVIQGGDPRGDGWGGPGYAIRSEFGLERYERGSVGVASAGKDTEGCQWFVTHSYTPHLDGRYTIFGKVISGMEVVDTIHIGDRIIAMHR